MAGKGNGLIRPGPLAKPRAPREEIEKKVVQFFFSLLLAFRVFFAGTADEFPVGNIR